MFIKIVGKPKKDLSGYIVKKAARFYGEYLMGKKLSKNVDLTIEFKLFDKGCNEYAYCDWRDDNHRARSFLITLDSNLTKRETFLALAHEMVHVKQYAKGEMKDIFRPARMTKWHGEKYDSDNMDYWEQPWEIEAYGREKGLYFKFMNMLKEEDECI